MARTTVKRIKGGDATATARSAYVEALRSQRKAALLEVTEASALAETAAKNIATSGARVRELALQLRAVGETVPETGLPAALRSASTGGAVVRTHASTSSQASIPEGGMRYSNDSNLEQMILQVVRAQPRGTVFTVPSVMAGVQALGYRTTADSFKTIVNQRLLLLVEDGRINHPNRGQYTMGRANPSTKKVAKRRGRPAGSRNKTKRTAAPVAAAPAA